jgi:hypothetical protein
LDGVEMGALTIERAMKHKDCGIETASENMEE